MSTEAETVSSVLSPLSTHGHQILIQSMALAKPHVNHFLELPISSSHLLTINNHSFSPTISPMFLLSFLGLLALSVAAIHGHRHASPLEVRQAPAAAPTSDVIVPLVTCEETFPVKACGITDLTTANWRAFGIDDFLVEFLQTFGMTQNFPREFVLQQSPIGSPHEFGCFFVDDQACIHAVVRNSASETDCAFTTIPNVVETVCNRYLSPQAAFVVQNYINLWQGVQNNFRAVEDAGRAILNSNFVNDVVDGLSEEKGSIFQAVFEAIVSIVIGFLPFGAAFKVGAKLFTRIDSILGFTGDDVLGGPVDVVKTINANDNIDDLAERIKDQLTRQIQDIITTEQSRMQTVLDRVFGTVVRSRAIVSADDARNSPVFQFAGSGEYLDGVPTREQLAANIEKNLKNFVVSSTISNIGWEFLLDPRELFEPPPVVSGTVCRANKGIPNVLGVPCGLFRTGGFDGKRMNNPEVLSGLIDVKEMFDNASGCGGGQPDWQAVINGEDGQDRLPRCMYNFKVTRL